MRVPRSLLFSAAFAAGPLFVFGQASADLGEPILGPAVVLGVDENQPGGPPAELTEPVLGPIILLAANFHDGIGGRNEVESAGEYSKRSDGRNEGTSSVAVHPDQIHSRLTEVARNLASAGLPIESRKIQEIQRQIFEAHSNQLMLAFKEAQLATLQAEINRLKECQKAMPSELPSADAQNGDE